jgi:hypothetical protein
MMGSAGRVPLRILATLLCCLAGLNCGGGASPASNSTTGTGAAQLAVSPVALNFGTVTVGQNASKTITVTNQGNVTATVSQATVAASTFAPSGLTLPISLTGGQSVTFSVVFAPTSSGPATSNLTLVDNGSVSSLLVALSGMGATAPPPSFSISGTVSPAASGSGATLTLAGAAQSTASADASGNYSFTGLANGTYTVTPSKTGFTFSPPNQSVPVSGANVTGTNFAATPSSTPSSPSSPSSFSISGTMSPAANGSGATVTLAGAAQATTAVDASGNYSFTGLANGTYTVTPSKTGFTFSPPNQSLSLSGSSATSTNFTAMQLSGPVVITNQNGTVIQGLRITSTTGDCVQITDSTNITIEDSDIGPCSGGVADSDGIKISSSNGVYVYDNYIHPEALSPGCCDHEDGVFVQQTIDGPVENITVQGNVIAYGETNIEMITVNTASVIGNFLLNPRGPYPRGSQFQCGTNCTNITVKNNYTLNSTDTTTYLYAGNQYDSINFGAVDPFVAQGNYVTGGQTASGCGLIADQGANNGQFLNNLVLNSGQCGIGIANGSHTVDGNKVYNTTPVVGGGNVGIYIGNPTNSCGPVTVSNNISDEIESDGTHNGYNVLPCAGVTPAIVLTGNTFDAAADPLLTPVTSVFPTPLIPPGPKNCVAISPYSTQVSMPGCIP